MAREMGHDDMADRFQIALEQEVEHLTKVRNWYTVLSMKRVR